jgi:phosphohistidine phosphatase
VIVYFLRHGIAERQSPGRDRERRLTEEGKAELRRVLAFAKKAQVKPELVVCSPYVRAVETARLAMDVLELEGSHSLADALVPESSAIHLWNEVRAHRTDSILVVSHEPLLSSTVAMALGTSRAMVVMPPGGLVTIEFGSTGAEAVGVLRWMVTPEFC